MQMSSHFATLNYFCKYKNFAYIEYFLYLCTKNYIMGIMRPTIANKNNSNRRYITAVASTNHRPEHDRNTKSRIDNQKKRKLRQ